MRKRTLGFQITQGFYWLSLVTWFALLLALAIAAAVTFKTVRAHEVTIGAPGYDAPALVDRHPTILAGGIVGNIIDAFFVVQYLCLAVLVITLLLQHTAFKSYIVGGLRGWRNLLRVLLIAGAAAIALTDALYINPTIHQHRQVMYAAEADDQARAQARTAFDTYHKASERLVGVGMLLILGAVFSSALTLHSRDEGDE